MKKEHLVAAFVLVIAMAATVFFLMPSETTAPTPTIDETTARELAVAAWGDCDGTDANCRELLVTVIDGEDGGLLLQAIHDGLADDSVRASRVIAPLSMTGGIWTLGEEILRDHRCQEGRGHDDFSTELCI